MSSGYGAVGWNRQKKIYDLTLAAGVALFIAVFVGLGLALRPHATAETLLIRAFAVAAFLLLHGILCIGPLARLDRRFLPLLYNRRHLGVTMCLLACAHAGLAVFQFSAFGVLDPFVNVLAGDGTFAEVSRWPFQVFGAAALAILIVMAATSHDFWLATLTAPVWKAMHMLVYVAYALLVAHVAIWIGQTGRGSWFAVATGVGAAVVFALHIAAAARERRGDAEKAAGQDGWIEVGPVESFTEKRARTVCASGERIAVFRNDGKFSAVSNVCQHQNGPLGEGRIIDGCITCPWHGYQYLPETGASPPPFTEAVPTFRVLVKNSRVFVDPRPLPPGTRVEPATIQ
jgi:nitrite reductase/ring-hydroxylating ferredoxin subunit/DMSO/TMAO reductase YedYZ heme-binding membrane subunit